MTEKISPLKAIRNNCIECSGGNRREADRCHLTSCALWSFRFGKNPFLKREMTEEQKEAARKRLAQYRK